MIDASGATLACLILEMDESFGQLRNTQLKLEHNWTTQNTQLKLEHDWTTQNTQPLVMA